MTNKSTGYYIGEAIIMVSIVLALTYCGINSSKQNHEERMIDKQIELCKLTNR